MKRPSRIELLVYFQIFVICVLVGYNFWRQTIPGMIWDLRWARADVQQSIIRKLADRGVGAAAAIPALEERLNDSDENTQIAAAHALNNIGGIKALAELMKSPDDQIRERALGALCNGYPAPPQEREEQLLLFENSLNDRSLVVRRRAREAGTRYCESDSRPSRGPKRSCIPGPDGCF